MKTGKVRIISNEKISDRYWRMKVDASGVATKVEPGQFFHIQCANGIYPLLRRPISVYRINSANHSIEFLYLVKGLGTMKLTELRPNESIDLFGPLGNGFHLNDNDKTILLVARGVGIATLAALAYQAVEKKKTVVAILSARSKNDLLASDYLAVLGVKVFKITDEEGTSDVEKVETLIEKILRDYHVNALYTCGSKRLSRLIQRIGKEEGIHGEIALEEHMGCAMGVCFACVCDLNYENEVKSVRICVDGPVFPLERVVIK